MDVNEAVGISRMNDDNLIILNSLIAKELIKRQKAKHDKGLKDGEK